METIAKVISLCLLSIFGAAMGISYLYDPGFFNSSFESDSVSTSQYYKTETVSPSNLSYYKNHLLEDSRVETQPPENTNPNSESLWTDTYDKPRPSKYSTLQEAKKLADKNPLNVLGEKKDYWYNRYRKALQSGKIKESTYAYSQFENYKEALEIKRGSL